jgi:hypothetical protein
MVGLQPGNEPDTSRILVTRVTSVTFTSPVPIYWGGGLQHNNFPPLPQRESAEETNESYHSGRP